MPHRQLLADSGMSLPDYDVLTALTVAGAGKDADHSARRTYRLRAQPGVPSRAADERPGPGDVRPVRRRPAGHRGDPDRPRAVGRGGGGARARRSRPAAVLRGLPAGLLAPLSEANHRDSVMISHILGGKPGSVTTDIRSLEMTKAQPRPGEAGRRLHRRGAATAQRTTNTLKLPFAAILPGPLPRRKGTVMPNAVVMTGYGPPEVLKWAAVPLPEPGPGQIRIKVEAAGISPTDLALRAGYLK